ncbi:MAG: repeat-containing protein, partial [Chthoniobacteraceae bacterium]|nr:repeat-containing protein [Chthoniobacteraceae bacterium]
LSTSEAGGSYLLFIEKGSAVIYTTDLNGNNQVDFNEITGISAGDGLRLISFVDIHGDIVTNLKSNGTLTDSDNNAGNGLDGRTLLNSRIEKIELRSLTQEDLPVGSSVSDRLALSTYSIFGNIYAGAGFGATDGGLIIDVTGKSLQREKFTGTTGIAQFVEVAPSIASIKVGTAASGEIFSFGTSAAGRGLGFNGEDVEGIIQAFHPDSGQNGADIIGLKIADGISKFNLGTLQAGDGGFNGRGGHIMNVTVTGDMAGGYKLIAGNAGDGNTGKEGGSIINFSDLGSITSEVVLQSGNGGHGLFGAGGPGGNIDLVNETSIQIAGRLIVNLGNGGDGLTAGGAGGSQKSGSFTTPEGGIPFGVNLVSSTHQSGDIYNTKPGTQVIRGFDFDLDGFNDVVYSSGSPSQLVVLFGSATGFDEQGTRYPGAPGTIYLNGPANAEALVVADLNGDGFVDIAAASANNSAAGVSVFLSSYTVDPVSGKSTFAGFHDPSFNALPALSDFSFFEKALKITAISAGDYDGDGVVDLVINTQQHDFTQLDPEASFGSNVIIVMKGDSSALTAPQGTGHFYADFVNGSPVSVLSPNTNKVVLKSTALIAGAQDYFVAGVERANSLVVYNYTSGSLASTTIGLGQIDTEREVSDPGKRDRISLVNAQLADFTILDVDGDQRADIVALTAEPAGFLVALKGDGTLGVLNNEGVLVGGFVIASNDLSDDTSSRAGENSGIDLQDAAPKGLNITGSLVGILTTSAQADGQGNDISIVSYEKGVRFVNLSFPANDFFKASIANTKAGIAFSSDPVGTIQAFDTYRPVESNTGNVGFGFAVPLLDSNFDLIKTTLSVRSHSIANNGFFITAGDGGDSAIGKGGAAGQVGDQLSAVDGQPIGTLNIVLPSQPAFEPVVRLVAGNGGNGYTGGGAGGDVKGVTISAINQGSSNVGSLLFAGDGGDSVKGAGGAGGNLNSLSVLGGQSFVGGNGGRGVIGGQGGSITGNKIAGLPDTTNAQTVSLAVQGGKGGAGLKTGGAGGGIINFTPDIQAVTGGESNTVLFYRGGAGGNALSGVGGAGGSIINSSPVSTENNLVSDIQLEGGRGGNGLTGGKGGSISNFLNSPGQGSLPYGVSVLAGYGGIGTARNGGSGGDITGVNITGRGVGFVWTMDFTNPEKIEAFPGIRSGAITFGRYIAGEGAVSYGATGGTGGNISSVTGVATSASFAVAAGKGGDGLREGAAGGNVTAASINAAATLGKVLVIGGDGGDVYGSLSTANDPLAFGGLNGAGGNGGNISGVSQNASQSTIVDIIAGGGGSTINHGTSLDLTTKAGRGGSISNVDVAGDIGDVAPAAAIVAYNNIKTGELIADFVTRTLIQSPGADLRAAGNVGIVVGATGRVKDNNGDGILDPASVGINGSLSNVLASNIMSAIAGSVDRIASIENLINVRTRSEGAIYGADKSAPVPASIGTLDYLDEAGNRVQAPVLGGELLDGAVIAKNDRPLKSIRDFVRR